MARKHLPSCTAGLLILLGLTLLPVPSEGTANQQEIQPRSQRVRTEIPYRDGTVVLVSDYQERMTRTRYRADGNVEVTYQDVVITCSAAEYDEETRKGFTTGTTRFSQNEKWLTCSRAEFDFGNQTGVFFDATGYLDREFLVRGETVAKTGRDTYRIEKGFVTTCQEDRPKWSFSMSNASIRVDQTARLRNVLFKVKGVPVFYAPYMIVPMERKRRSSGLLPFHVGSSTSKGRVFSLGYFQTLGNSADLAIHGDYFSERGLGVGGVFRARPNDAPRLHIEGWGIGDRLDQGGAHLLVDGESRFENGFRAVASVNITTNFRFRQAFLDSFRSATESEERSTFFMTRNQDSYSTNIVFQRDEVLFPVRSLVIRKSPSIEFYSLGKSLGPAVFSLRAAAEGLSRIGGDYETPKMVQRLDFYPRVSFRIPSFAGFSLNPTVGIRETYYSARLTNEETPEIRSSSLHRQYFTFELDLRMPTLEKTYQSNRLGKFKHVLEPIATYRRIEGIGHNRETIRFDEQDPIVDTSELEYGIVTRIFRSRDNEAGAERNYEFLSLKLAQKYYFDPAFGDAFRPGELNVFYPLNTLTGFAATGIERRLAPASMILRLTPKPRISYDVRADYDARLKRFRDASVSTYWQQEKLFIAATYLKANALEPWMLDSHHIQGQAGYGTVSKGWSASVTLSYNIRTAKLLNSHTRLLYSWDCCGVALQYQQFDLGLRTESRFNFSFTLKGIGSFGSLKRSESLF